MALYTLHAGKWVAGDGSLTEQEVAEASLQVALGLLEP
jgi:hypothetical protein